MKCLALKKATTRSTIPNPPLRRSELFDWREGRALQT